MIVLVDNYDSFTYNIKELLHLSGFSSHLCRPDQFIDCPSTDIQGIIIGPGPGSPKTTPLNRSIINYAIIKKIPLLGVCLGHQWIAYYFGARIHKMGTPIHGKAVSLIHDQKAMYAHIDSPLQGVQYHSLAVNPSSMKNSPELYVTATSLDGTIMGLRHQTLAIEGIQYHLESILSEDGSKLLHNFFRPVAA